MYANLCASLDHECSPTPVGSNGVNHHTSVLDRIFHLSFAGDVDLNKVNRGVLEAKVLKKRFDFCWRAGANCESKRAALRMVRQISNDETACEACSTEDKKVCFRGHGDLGAKRVLMEVGYKMTHQALHVLGTHELGTLAQPAARSLAWSKTTEPQKIRGFNHDA